MIEKLQIYKDTYMLTTKLYAVLPRMERMHKHLIGARMLDASVQLFTHIALANKATEKAERLYHLDGYLSTFETLRVQIRICSDMKLLPITTLADLFMIVDNISRQLAGWRAATSRVSRATASTA